MLDFLAQIEPGRLHAAHRPANEALARGHGVAKGALHHGKRPVFAEWGVGDAFGLERFN